MSKINILGVCFDLVPQTHEAFWAQAPLRQAIAAFANALEYERHWACTANDIRAQALKAYTGELEAPEPPTRRMSAFSNYFEGFAPTKAELDSPEFEAVWQTIKTWDVGLDAGLNGYCGAMGHHAVMITRALAAHGLEVHYAGQATTPCPPPNDEPPSTEPVPGAGEGGWKPLAPPQPEPGAYLDDVIVRGYVSLD